MKESAAQRPLVSRLLRHAEEGQLPANATITLRVSGGVRGQRLDKSISIMADGAARLQVTDELRNRATDVRFKLDQERVLDLTRELGLNLDDLVRKEEANFLPDSLVGSVSVRIGDEVETYYFLADEEMYVDEGRPMPSGVRGILDRFRAIENECGAPLQRDGEPEQ